MGVETAHRTKEALARQPKLGARRNQPGDHAQLAPKVRVWKRRGEVGTVQGLGEHALGVDRAHHNVSPGLLQQMRTALGERLTDGLGQRIAWVSRIVEIKTKVTGG